MHELIGHHWIFFPQSWPIRDPEAQAKSLKMSVKNLLLLRCVATKKRFSDENLDQSLNLQCECAVWQPFHVGFIVRDFSIFSRTSSTVRNHFMRRKKLKVETILPHSPQTPTLIPYSPV